MSLDVYLNIPNAGADGTGIFIRENGQVRQMTRTEWNERFPDREPIVVERDSDCVYQSNITHNLGKMAGHAGLYLPMWRPDEIGIIYAHQLIEPLRAGLDALLRDPDFMKLSNPENGWGNYDNLVEFTRQYLAACEKYPYAEVSVWR